METPADVTLATLAEGAPEELFREALRAVLANVDDPNTDWKARRRIQLTFDVATDEERRSAKVTVACSTKLAGIRPVATFVHIGRRGGVLAAVEAARNEELFPTDKQAGRPQAVPAAGGTEG